MFYYSSSDDNADGDGDGDGDENRQDYKLDMIPTSKRASPDLASLQNSRTKNASSKLR